MNNQTISFLISYAHDAATGLVTGFIDGDYGTVTQAADMDQLKSRLLTSRNLVLKAREKYGFKPEVRAPRPSAQGAFKTEKVTYQVAA